MEESAQKLSLLLYQYPHLVQACMDKTKDLLAEEDLETVSYPHSAVSPDICQCECCKISALPFPWNPMSSTAATQQQQVSHMYITQNMIHAWQYGLLLGLPQSIQPVDFFHTTPDCPMLYSPYDGVSKEEYPQRSTNLQASTSMAQHANTHSLYPGGVTVPAHCHIKIPSSSETKDERDSSHISTSKSPQHSVPTKKAAQIETLHSYKCSSCPVKPVILPSDASARTTSYHQTSKDKFSYYGFNAAAMCSKTSATNNDSMETTRPDSGLCNFDEESSLYNHPHPGSMLLMEGKRPSSALSNLSEQDSGIDEMRSRSVTPPPEPLPTTVEEEEYVNESDNTELDLETSELDFTGERSNLSGEPSSSGCIQLLSNVPCHRGPFVANSLDLHGSIGCGSDGRLVIVTDSEEDADDELDRVPFTSYSSPSSSPQEIIITQSNKNHQEINNKPYMPWQPWLSFETEDVGKDDDDDDDDDIPTIDEPLNIMHCDKAPSLSHGLDHADVQDSRRNTSTPLPWAQPDQCQSEQEDTHNVHSRDSQTFAQGQLMLNRQNVPYRHPYLQQPQSHLPPPLHHHHYQFGKIPHLQHAQYYPSPYGYVRPLYLQQQQHQQQLQSSTPLHSSRSVKRKRQPDPEDRDRKSKMAHV